MRAYKSCSVLLIIAVLVVAACSSGETDSEDAASTTAASPAVGATDEPEDGTGTSNSGEAVICENPPPTVVALGTSTSDEIVDPPRPADYARCFTVEVPSGIETLVLTLTDLSDDLNLAVGYGSVEAVQTPGIAPYWRSGELGVSDEVITIEDPEAGSYFVVVSSGTYRNESPFTLTVDSN